VTHPSRRDLCSGLAALAALNTSNAYAASDGEAALNHSERFPYDKLPVSPSSNKDPAARLVGDPRQTTSLWQPVSKSQLLTYSDRSFSYLKDKLHAD